MAHGFNDRVFCSTATVGTGNVTIGAAKPAHCTPAQAGTPNGETRTWLLEEGNDFEIFRGAYTAAGTVATRGTVLLSQVGGVTGTTRMNLAGSATIREVASGSDLISIVNSGAFGLSLLGAALASNAWTLLDASSPASAAYRRGNIIGLVSQAGGIPTGAVIETGANANGTYIRFADGLQICRGQMTVAASAGTNWSSGGGTGSFSYTNGAESWVAPATFATVPNLVATARDGAVSARASYVAFAGATTGGVGSCYCAAPVGATAAGSAANDILVDILAIGRWY